MGGGGRRLDTSQNQTGGTQTKPADAARGRCEYIPSVFVALLGLHITVPFTEYIHHH